MVPARPAGDLVHWGVPVGVVWLVVVGRRLDVDRGLGDGDADPTIPVGAEGAGWWRYDDWRGRSLLNLSANATGGAWLASRAVYCASPSLRPSRSSHQQEYA